MSPLKSALTLVTVVLLAVPSVQAKKKPADFSKLEGTYKGSAVVALEDEPSMSAMARVHIEPAKNGQSATMTLSGVIAAGIPSPYSTEIKLKRNGGATSSDVLTFKEDGVIVPSTGTYTQASARKVNVTTSVIYQGEMVTQAVVLKVTPKGRKKKKLEMTVTIFAYGMAAITYDITAIGR